MAKSFIASIPAEFIAAFPAISKQTFEFPPDSSQMPAYRRAILIFCSRFAFSVSFSISKDAIADSKGEMATFILEALEL